MLRCSRSAIQGLPLTAGALLNHFLTFLTRLMSSLEAAAWRAEQRRQEAFLSQAQSLEELEHLQRAWERQERLRGKIVY